MSEARPIPISINRRAFFATAAAGCFAAPHAFAMGPDSQVGIGLLQHGTGYDQRPGAVEQLMWETTKRTSIDVRQRPVFIDPRSPNLFESPLLVWIGTGPCEPFDEKTTERLGRFLRAGGLLFIDDATPHGDDGFDACVRREVARLMPGREFVQISNDHTIYRSFFLLEKPFGRISRSDHLMGVSFDDRSPILYGRNDLLGAMGRDSLGNWRMPVVPGGERQRELAIRMGINLLMYANCLNYKRDQVHVTAILHRRRWRTDSRGSVR